MYVVLAVDVKNNSTILIMFAICHVQKFMNFNTISRYICRAIKLNGKGIEKEITI